MICQKCNKNPANVKVVQQSGAFHQEMHLCQSCANKLQQEIFSSTFGGMALPKHPTRKELTCPTCGQTTSGLVSTGRLGCADCYQIFAEEVQTLVRRAQGGAQKHTGKTPKMGTIKSAPKTPVKVDPIPALREELKQAIIKENYEQAAKLRDEIKQLEKGDIRK